MLRRPRHAGAGVPARRCSGLEVLEAAFPGSTFGLLDAAHRAPPRAAPRHMCYNITYEMTAGKRTYLYPAVLSAVGRGKIFGPLSLQQRGTRCRAACVRAPGRQITAVPPQLLHQPPLLSSLSVAREKFTSTNLCLWLRVRRAAWRNCAAEYATWQSGTLYAAAAAVRAPPVPILGTRGIHFADVLPIERERHGAG
jgi:hypothetical protein